MQDYRAMLEGDGYAVIDKVIDAEAIEAIRKLAVPLLDGAARARPGVRRVFEKQPAFIAVLRDSPVPQLIGSLTTATPRVVRTILFDKSPDANWAVPWHQDSVIALRERRDTEGFGPWSIKDGEPHCRPPRHILDSIGVLRISIDPCGPENGPLRVIPGSHSQGLLDHAEFDAAVVRTPHVECCTDSGGAVLMRPHTVHASPRAVTPSHRRVLHIEFSDAVLPNGLQWAEAVML